MALLTAAEIDEAVQDYIDMVYRELGIRADYDVAVIRTQALNTDGYIDTIQTAYNNVLTAPYKTNASLKEKTFLFTAIANKRAEKSS